MMKVRMRPSFRLIMMKIILMMREYNLILILKIQRRRMASIITDLSMSYPSIGLRTSSSRKSLIQLYYYNIREN